MTDLGLTHSLQANTDLTTDHASAGAGATSAGALHASEGGASYDGHAGAGASYATDAASGDVSADATGAASGEGATVTPDVDGLPDLPHAAPELPLETPALPVEAPGLPLDVGALEGAAGSASVEGTLSVMVASLGELFAELAASLGAVFG